MKAIYMRTNATTYIYSARHIMEHYSRFKKKKKNAAINQVNIFYSPKTLTGNAILGRI